MLCQFNATKFFCAPSVFRAMILCKLNFARSHTDIRKLIECNDIADWMLKCDVVAADVEDRRNSAGLVPDPLHRHPPAGCVSRPTAADTAGSGGGVESGSVGHRAFKVKIVTPTAFRTIKSKEFSSNLPSEIITNKFNALGRPHQYSQLAMRRARWCWRPCWGSSPQFWQTELRWTAQFGRRWEPSSVGLQTTWRITGAR